MKNNLKHLQYFENYTMEEVNERIFYNIIEQNDVQALDKFVSEVENVEEFINNEKIFKYGVKKGSFKTVKYLVDNNYVDKEAINVKNMELNISNKDLNTLEGIEILDSLIKLDCSVNNITDVEPLKYLKNIEWVDATLNNITSIEPLKNLENLEKINFERNSIKSVDGLLELSYNSPLYEVILENNLIEDITELESLFNIENPNERYVVGSEYTNYGMDKPITGKFINLYYNPLNEESRELLKNYFGKTLKELTGKLRK